MQYRIYEKIQEGPIIYTWKEIVERVNKSQRNFLIPSILNLFFYFGSMWILNI